MFVVNCIKMPLNWAQKRLIYASITLLLFVYFSGLHNHIFEKDYYSQFVYPYEVDSKHAVTQLLENKKPSINPINVYNYEFIKSPPEKCSLVDTPYPYKIRLVYLIKSSPDNFKRRTTIRSTWGFEKRFSDVEIRTIFILGFTSNKITQSGIDEEYQKYNDIVQANFVDSYFNNTIKTVIGMKWAVTNCNNSKFYMFVDDDYYVSTRNVLRFLRNPLNYPHYLQKSGNVTKQKNKLPFVRKKRQIEYELPEDVKLYAGYVMFTSPLRHITSKWYVSLEEYPFDKWPPYVTAGSYILSRRALFELYYTSFYTKHFRFDDIYLALVAKKAGIIPLHNEEFNFYKKTYGPNNYQYTIASHGFDDSEELIQIWTQQKSLGNA